MDDGFAEQRQRLCAEIAAEVHALRRHLGKDALDPQVMRAIGMVPRHAFVPEEWRADAYRNRPLPIGGGQTISQPLIVAVMTDIVAPEATSRILEIGTGCGYQAAVLAEIAAEIYSVEVLPALHAGATRRLAALGYGNVRTRLGDGWEGWPEHAPYDAIVVTAAASHLPKRLVEQLRPGGRMAIPIGSRNRTQWLRLVRRTADGFESRDIMPVAFVPLVEAGTGGIATEGG